MADKWAHWNIYVIIGPSSQYFFNGQSTFLWSCTQGHERRPCLNTKKDVFSFSATYADGADAHQIIKYSLCSVARKKWSYACALMKCNTLKSRFRLIDHSQLAGYKIFVLVCGESTRRARGCHYLPVREFQRLNQNIERRCLKSFSYIKKKKLDHWTIRSPAQEKDMYTPTHYSHHRLWTVTMVSSAA